MTRPCLALMAGLALALTSACNGLIGSPKGSADGGTGPIVPSTPDPCLSDPDLSGSVVCDSGSEWQCVAQNSQIQCHKGTYDVPGGAPSNWNCSDGGEFVTCTGPADAPTGNPGWECYLNELGKMVCVSQTPDEPGMGGPWDCVYDDVAGVTCISDDTGSWGCRQEGTSLICHNDHADTPNDNPGWTCKPQAGGVTCHNDTPGESADGSGWTCTSDANGTTCFTPTPDQPGFGGPWDCVFDDVGGVNCTSDSGGGWICVPDGDGNTVCTNDNPSTPDGGQWECYDADGKTICVGTGDSPGGGSWTCQTDDVGRTICEQTPEYPPDSPGNGTWTCWYDDVGNRVCSDSPPDTPNGGCVPGTKRWCDGATYCSWGQQTCLPSGSWGPCYEDPGQRANTLCACYFFYFNPDCCETPDCIVPPNTTPQVCAPSTGKLCDYCSSSGDCQAGGRCIFTNTGESFCGQDCTTQGCPSGYGCRTVTDQGGSTYKQCVPNDLSCYY